MKGIRRLTGAIMATTNVSWDDVLAVMPHKVIHNILGKPTYSAMRTWFKKICTNLIAAETPKDCGRVKVHLGMLQAPSVFHAQNGDFYNPPPNAPIAYHNILPGVNTAERKRLRAEYKVFYVHWAKYVHTGHIAVNVGATAFVKWLLAALEDPDEGLNGVTICNVYDYVLSNYATISQAEVDANLEKFNKPINASQTLAVYICKQ